MSKIEYRYDEKGLYVGEELAQLDPMATKRLGKEVYLLAANCTFIAPIKEKNKVSIWDNEKQRWFNEEDLIGKCYYDFKKNSIVVISENKIGQKYRILKEEELKELYAGKKIREIGEGRYQFYYPREVLEDKVISSANRYLSETDFYFNSDYPTDKIPEKMREYRIYLRTLNSKKNLEGKDLENLEVLSFEKFSA